MFSIFFLEGSSRLDLLRGIQEEREDEMNVLLGHWHFVIGGVAVVVALGRGLGLLVLQ